MLPAMMLGSHQPPGGRNHCPPATSRQHAQAAGGTLTAASSEAGTLLSGHVHGCLPRLYAGFHEGPQSNRLRGPGLDT